MTRQESFKRRIRTRMEKTGEKYGAARRSLLTRSPGSRPWVSDPEMTEDAVQAATGRGWDEWCDIVDAWPGHTDGHSAIAAHLHDVHGVDGWWAQSVTVGWERITGRRLPHQRADGTFTVSKSRTMTVDVAVLRQMLADDTDRSDLFPGIATELRSRPSSKALRVGFEPGAVLLSFDPVGPDRTRVTVTHERLADTEQVEQWRGYWEEWLEAIATA